MLHHKLLAIAGTGLAGLIFLFPQAALARAESRPIGLARDNDRRPGPLRDNDLDGGWDSRWDSRWDDYNRTLIQLQRESLSSQEEQAREAGRVLRRDEIEKNQEKSSAEHEAYFDAILEDSQAALKAPQGVYYRKPGYSSAEGPGSDARTIEVGGFRYLYDHGIFWLHQGSSYTVVTAPVGATADKLPQGVTRIVSGARSVWYFFGSFFAEKGGAYEVIKPPAGLTVFYLPDGYSQEKVQGVGLYRFGDVLFKPVFIQGILAYQVVEP